MRDLLFQILRSSAPPEAVSWLEEAVSGQEADFQRRPFYYAFSGVSRHFPKKAKVEVSSAQTAELSKLAPGLAVERWDPFRLARVLLLLVLAKQEKAVFLETLSALLNTADLREQAAIFSAFPLFPHQEELVESARDGLRSNIVDIFDSIALDNPFPARHFPDEAWNQMVLKAIFIQRPLHRIEGIDHRRNAELAAAISSLAHERWAAGRRLTPEAWRNCASLVTDGIADDLRHLVSHGDLSDRKAAALLVAGGDSRLSDLRADLAELIAEVGTDELTWTHLGKELECAVTLNGSPAKP
ncbi:MAG TPA: EboA domain-containing protein [Bacteroidia bacterium]|nr:EboA domain-containing protein [Bacteroidia bacterium]